MSAPNQAPLLKVPTPGNRPKPRLMIPQSAPGKPFNSTTGVISFPDSTGPGNVSGGVGVGGGVVGDFGSTGPVGAAYNDANDRTVEDAEKSSLTQPISSAQYQAAVPAPLAIGVPSSGSSPAHPKRTPGARPPLPKLQLAMPKPSTGKNTPQPLQVGTISAPSQQQQQQQSQQSSSLSGSADHSKSGTYAQGTGSVNNPASASGPPSSYSALSLAMGIKQSHPHGSGDASGMGSVYEESAEDLTRDLDKLSLELGRPVDADDLDDEGWLAARTSGRIVELDVLGEGAGGAVTKCKLRDGKTVFALKVITTDPNPDVKKQIFREINFNKDCRSDYICRYYGAFMDRSSSTISIAMEFCEGGSLDSIYREVKNLGGRTGEKVLGKVAEGVLNGLTYLHSLKIIHR
ncbi:Protein kinase C signaling pathway involved MAPKK protein, partial [Ascosphaera aggregata]